MVLGCGQFCTNPGLILGIKSAEFSQLISNLTEIMGAKPAQTMLNAGTLKSYTAGLEHLTEHQGIKHLAGNTQKANRRSRNCLKLMLSFYWQVTSFTRRNLWANHSHH